MWWTWTRSERLQVQATQLACPVIWTQWSQASSAISSSGMRCSASRSATTGANRRRSSLGTKIRRVNQSDTCYRMRDTKFERQIAIGKWKVGGRSAAVLRDSGCTRVIVKRDLVSQDQLCGTYGYAMAFDRFVIRAPIAKIRVDTPYYVGEVNALCFREPIFELIIGNIPDAREPDDPNPTWGYVTRTKQLETQTIEMDIAEGLEAEEERCKLPGKGEQRKAEWDVD